MTHPSLTLYIGKGCSFCLRVLNYLENNPMPIQIKDVWNDDQALNELQTLTGKTQVPCLQMGNSFMHESLDIIEKLKQIKTDYA